MRGFPLEAKRVTHCVVHKSCTKSLGQKVTELNSAGRRLRRIEFRAGRQRRTGVVQDRVRRAVNLRGADLVHLVVTRGRRPRPADASRGARDEPSSAGEEDGPTTTAEEAVLASGQPARQPALQYRRGGIWQGAGREARRRSLASRTGATTDRGRGGFVPALSWRRLRGSRTLGAPAVEV
jgi:hypothetical protein